MTVMRLFDCEILADVCALSVPLAVTGLVLLFFQPWYWGVGCIVVGYVLQYIGHEVEGNDVGD